MGRRLDTVQPPHAEWEYMEQLGKIQEQNLVTGLALEASLGYVSRGIKRSLTIRVSSGYGLP